ncbi:hypothetical protein B0H10DRAFT_2085408 [Mycena sp. CBHHK59/15]|nr:hypothetical protein B0H10DRAFT_2085408 [Mycena sp. CBHHK59/15]
MAKERDVLLVLLASTQRWQSSSTPFSTSPKRPWPWTGPCPTPAEREGRRGRHLHAVHKSRGEQGPASSKRASLTPPTGSFNPNAFVGRPNSHRCISSVSDSNIAHTVPDITSPVTERSFVIPAPNRRLSGFFGRSSPSREPRYLPSPSPDEFDNLRKEPQTIRHALDETCNELTEANEPKEASETRVTPVRVYPREQHRWPRGRPMPRQAQLGWHRLPHHPTRPRTQTDRLLQRARERVVRRVGRAVVAARTCRTSRAPRRRSSPRVRTTR